jgi:hypothetical protein
MGPSSRTGAVTLATAAAGVKTAGTVPP